MKNVETQNSKLDTLQSMLDAAGFVPGYGEPADAANAIISLFRGNIGDAGLSALSMIPFLGSAASIKKLDLGKKGKILRNQKNEEIRQGWFEEALGTALDSNPDISIGQMDDIANLMTKLKNTDWLENLLDMLRKTD
jgi:hypothetical protein